MQRQALDEQVLDFVGCGASGRLQQARLDPQHLGATTQRSPVSSEMGESFFDNFQRGIAVAHLSVSLGFEREDWVAHNRSMKSSTPMAIE
jgi:hypothetical protein